MGNQDVNLLFQRPDLRIKLQSMYFRSKVFAPEMTRSLRATSCRTSLSVNIWERLRHFLITTKTHFWTQSGGKCQGSHVASSKYHLIIQLVTSYMTCQKPTNPKKLVQPLTILTELLARFSCLACCLPSSGPMKLRRSTSTSLVASESLKPSIKSMMAFPSTIRNWTWDFKMT